MATINNYDSPTLTTTDPHKMDNSVPLTINVHRESIKRIIKILKYVPDETNEDTATEQPIRNQRPSLESNNRHENHQKVNKSTRLCNNIDTLSSQNSETSTIGTTTPADERNLNARPTSIQGKYTNDYRFNVSHFKVNSVVSFDF